jgi:predicted phosphodiesterase
MKAYRNERILIISDTHFPYTNRDALGFLADLKEEVQPERVFHLGDLTDAYLFSSFSKDPDAGSLPEELRKTRKMVQELGDLFPEMVVMGSNHDERLYKRSREAGIPKGLLRPYPEIIGASTFNWKWVPDYTLRLCNRQHLYLAHTRGPSALALAKALGMNTAVGHHHSKCGVSRFANPLGNLFAIDTGCLIDDNSYSMAYNKQSLVRPILGAAAVVDGVPYSFTLADWKRRKGCPTSEKYTNVVLTEAIAPTVSEGAIAR